MSANIESCKLESGKLMSYAFPGGYPIFYVTKDSGILCPDCVNANLGQCLGETEGGSEYKQWQLAGYDINYEDNSLYCDHCNKKIESAYGEDDSNDA